MPNHLAKYYMNLLFIVVFGAGCMTVSLIGSFAEMMELYALSYNIDILLAGFNGAMIIAIIRSWRSIDREMKRRLNGLPLNQIEKDWMEKYNRFFLLFKGEQPQRKKVRMTKASRFKIHLLLTIVLLANILSLWVNLGL